MTSLAPEALGNTPSRPCRKEGEVERIAPVLALSTGRCGSTMMSEVLSLSEFFISVDMKALIRKRPIGKALCG